MQQINYSKNLSKLTPGEREAIEDDKALWFKAHTWVINFTVSQIKHQLELIKCPIEQEDLRQRLNETYKHYNKLKRAKNE